MNQMSPYEIIAKARDRLTGRWLKRKYRSVKGTKDTCRVCLAGAMNWAATGDPEYCAFADQPPGLVVAVNLIEREVGPIGVFNDKRATTEQVVIDLCNRVLKGTK